MIKVYCNLLLYIANNTEAVSCKTGDVRLVGGTKEYEGRLEVCINEVWGTVCSRSWDSTDTKVACRQLGHYDRGLLLIHDKLVAIHFISRWSHVWQ